MLNSEIAMFALNDIEDTQLESARVRLGYHAGLRAPVRKRRLWRSFLIAAVITGLFASAAWAADFLGFRALLLQDKSAQMLIQHEDGSVEWAENPDGAVVSISQPQELPENTPPEIRTRVENSRKAWAVWQEWHKENGLRWPEIYDGPEGTSFYNEEENPDGTYTVRFYAQPEERVDPAESLARMEQGDYSDFILLDERLATKEQHDQNLAAMDAIAMGYNGYDFKYNVNSREEAEKLEEIAAEYGLQLRRQKTSTFGSHADYLKAYDLPSGMDRDTWLSLDYNSTSTTEQLHRLSAGTSCGQLFFTDPDYIDHLYYFQEGSFGISGADRVNGRSVAFYLYNSMYGTLSNGLEVFDEIDQISNYSVRTHTARDGTELTVLSSGKAGDTAYVYTYLDHSFAVLTLHAEDILSEEEIDGLSDRIHWSEIS